MSTAIQWLTGEGRKNLIASKEHQTDFRFVFWSQNVRIKPILRSFSSPPKPRVAGSIPLVPAYFEQWHYIPEDYSNHVDQT